MMTLIRPKALAEFQRLRGDINKILSVGLSDKVKREAIDGVFRKLGTPLGLFQLSSKAWTFSHIRVTA